MNKPREKNTRPTTRVRASEDSVVGIHADTNSEAKKIKNFAPRNPAQAKLCEAIDNNVLTLGLGPAGTGKTYVAIAKAVEAFERGSVSRIILTRPAVEAGENIGYLPGDSEDKLAPYMRPLYDALSDRMTVKRMRSLMAEGAIEIAPVGFMRGRTLTHAFIVADEMQNTTPLIGRMIVGRIGERSKMVVTGDPQQCDLDIRHGQENGLSYLANSLFEVKNVIVHMSEAKDIVRAEVVRDTMFAFDAYDNRDKSKSGPNPT